MKQEELQERKKTLFWIIGLLIVFVIFGIIGLVNHQIVSRNESLLAKQNTEINGVKNEIDVQKAANNKKVAKAAETVTGIDDSKKRQNDKLMANVFQKTFTWSSGQAYRKARENAIKEFKLPKNGQFMKDFMPPLSQYDVSVHSSGENDIDKDHINLKYQDMTSYVTDVQGTNYKYFTVIQAQSHDLKGAVAEGDAVATYTIDNKGQIKDLKCYSVGYAGDDNQ